MKLTQLMIDNGYVIDETTGDLTRINGDKSRTMIEFSSTKEYGDEYFVYRSIGNTTAEWVATRYHLSQACEAGLQWDDPSTLLVQDCGCVFPENDIV